MKNKIKEFFRSINCLRPGGKTRKAKKQRVPTFNVISVILLASQTAAPAEVARRSMFVGVHQKSGSGAALCQPPNDDDDGVVLLSSSGAPANFPEDVVAATEPATSQPPHHSRRSRSSLRHRFVPCPRSPSLGRSTRRSLSFTTQPSRLWRLLLRPPPHTTRRRIGKI